MSQTELLEFWQDVSQVAKALDCLHTPVKINYCIFGHLCPHLHCHLLVHSYEDDPHKPINMNEQQVLLSQDEYRDLIQHLQKAIHDAM